MYKGKERETLASIGLVSWQEEYRSIKTIYEAITGVPTLLHHIPPKSESIQIETVRDNSRSEIQRDSTEKSNRKVVKTYNNKKTTETIKLHFKKSQKLTKMDNKYLCLSKM